MGVKRLHARRFAFLSLQVIVPRISKLGQHRPEGATSGSLVLGGQHKSSCTRPAVVDGQR